MGEINFVDTFVTSFTNRTMNYTLLSFIFLLAFTILMPVLFINLLIGLAVGDIDVIQKNAELKRFAIQVDFYTMLERRLPTALLKRVNRGFVTVSPNLPYHNNAILSWVIGKILKMFGISRNATCRACIKKEASNVGDDLASEELAREKLFNRIEQLETTLEKQTEMIQELIMRARNTN